MFLLVPLFLLSHVLTAVAEDCSQTVTLQRFEFENPSPESIQNLTAAMSCFKADHSDNVIGAFLGVIHGAESTLAEQIFLWNSPNGSSLDVATLFLPFSATKTLNVSATAVLPNVTSVYASLRAPVTETIIQDIIPGSDRDILEAVSAYLAVNIRFDENGYGSSIGWELDGPRRIVLNGWATMTVRSYSQFS
ncbi:hypothetical protein V5O48_009017 [Marasmius crinis-equi]|uniref:Uncharacterized protein n=1 Tax=Marasmius crinis-equi TaxID=585013 RepID=A0ABR3FCA8_9AGAR